jgi:uncharacterized surface protein with fasciclin (FAS1) repeats
MHNSKRPYDKSSNKAAGSVETLQRDLFTVFAPTNAAINTGNSYIIETARKFKNSPNLLTYHVVSR